MIEPRHYLHRAPYVLTMSTDPAQPAVISDGAVMTENGCIVAVAPYAELRDTTATLVEHAGRVLMPPLVNCHTHLELSYLARLAREDGPVAAGGFSGWVRRLLPERAKPVDPEEVLQAAWQALARLYTDGCRAVADIGNDPASRELGESFKFPVFFFQEFLGLAANLTAGNIATIGAIPDALACTAHAPYSTSPELIKLLKSRAERSGHLFPIHLAETAAETEFLASGTGEFQSLLAMLGSDSFVTPGVSPVAYLDQLGVLDDRTLAVHCTQVTGADITLLASRRTPVCLCPASNRYLGSGIAPATTLHAAGVKLVLGTDSLASNPSLDLWNEMQLLAAEHPALPPLAILAMATCNGAEVLGVAREFGSLTPGRSASFLAASVEPGSGDPQEIVPAALVQHGRPAQLEWVE
ncbi:MAG: amidohydrolase family protein [Desulfobulbaceae bacterium]|nr:amidohydrolase family protein [Desulfobulbaceae bacterium]